MNVSELTSEQLFQILLKLEHQPCQISYLARMAGMCPWCGEIGKHHEDCRLNKALLMYMEVEDRIWEVTRRWAAENADLVACQVLKDLKLVGDGGLMFFKLEDYIN